MIQVYLSFAFVFSIWNWTPADSLLAVPISTQVVGFKASCLFLHRARLAFRFPYCPALIHKQIHKHLNLQTQTEIQKHRKKAHRHKYTSSQTHAQNKLWVWHLIFPSDLHRGKNTHKLLHTHTLLVFILAQRRRTQTQTYTHTHTA